MGWQLEDKILKEVKRTELLLRAIDTRIELLEEELAELKSSQQSCCKDIKEILKKILEAIVPPPAVSFTAVITLNPTKGVNTMAKTAKASADLQVADNGTFTVSLFFVDSVGVKTSVPDGLSATYTSSDATPGPSIFTLTPSADTSSAAGAINPDAIAAIVQSGGALPTGLSISVTASWTGLSSPQTVVASPLLDVVAGPAASFIASEATP